MTRRKLTSKEIAYIRQLRQEGVTLREIALFANVSHATVAYHTCPIYNERHRLNHSTKPACYGRSPTR